MHEPALVSAPVPDNHGNRRGNLFGCNVKAGCVLWQIAVQVPADPYVTELECRRYATTHLESNLVIANGAVRIVQRLT